MPTSDYTPDVAEVGAILRARTQEKGTGNELGTFTDLTRPTAAQVTLLISDAVRDVSMAVGATLPPASWGQAKTVTATRTAMLIELSYFPEQINIGRSPYLQLEKLFKDRLAALSLMVQDGNDGTLGSEASGVPSYAFPEGPGIIGYQTRW